MKAEWSNKDSLEMPTTTSGDYIKREDAERLLRYYFLSALTEDERVDELNRVPSADVVEVVRCKDCKFWDSDCIWCDLWGNTQEYYDGYCSYGEREDDE